eukprot:11702043-Heterocapsa_arctica.AAC.1
MAQLWGAALTPTMLRSTASWPWSPFSQRNALHVRIMPSISMSPFRRLVLPPLTPWRYTQAHDADFIVLLLDLAL